MGDDPTPKRSGRAGGRAARVAARAAGPTEEEKAVRCASGWGRRPLCSPQVRSRLLAGSWAGASRTVAVWRSLKSRISKVEPAVAYPGAT